MSTKDDGIYCWLWSITCSLLFAMTVCTRGGFSHIYPVRRNPAWLPRIGLGGRVGLNAAALLLLAHLTIIPMFILFSSTSLPACGGCCTPICSPHLSLVSFHTIFPCRALCTHCGSPQRMKDVCFICLIHAKEDSVFLLKNTVLKYCLSGLPTSMKRLGFLCPCSWVLTLLVVFGYFSCCYTWHYHDLQWNCFWN